MLNVDFHCHTCYSKDSLTTLESLLEACQQKGIDRLVITDHNTIAGRTRARELDSQRFIVGEEIMTSAGELLAVYVQEEVPGRLPPMQAIQRLREQGAFISVSHPFDRMRSGGWQLPDLLQILPLIDAIETFNARCLWQGFNRNAQAFARQHGLPGTVGSDAHTLSELGQAALSLPDFDDPASLREAIRQGQPHLRPSGFWVHFFSRYARMKKK